MKLRDKLIQETILVPMQATSKEGANQELLTHLQLMDILSATVQLFANIKEQEKAFSSSAGRGIASDPVVLMTFRRCPAAGRNW